MDYNLLFSLIVSLQIYPVAYSLQMYPLAKYVNQ